MSRSWREKGEGLIVQGEEGCARAWEISCSKGPEAGGSRASFREQETVRCEPESFLSGSLTCGSE